MLAPQYRLCSPRDFRAAMRGSSAGSKLVVVHVRLRGAGSAPHSLTTPRYPRVGVVCSKTIGNSVVRHTEARRLRHIAANLLDGLPANADLVIRARPGIGGASAEELSRCVARCVDKAVSKAVAKASAGDEQGKRVH